MYTTMKPETLIKMLNVVYSSLDVLVEMHNVHKVETVGTVYMVSAGVAQAQPNHAQLCAHFGTCVSVEAGK